jgi:hypothetical protein
MRYIGLWRVALNTLSGIPLLGLWAFDIGCADDQSQVFYLADVCDASVEMIDTPNRFAVRKSFGGLVQL